MRSIMKFIAILDIIHAQYITNSMHTGYSVLVGQTTTPKTLSEKRLPPLKHQTENGPTPLIKYPLPVTS